MGIYIGQNKIGMVGSSSTSQVENGTLGTPTVSDSGLIVTKVEKSGYLNAGASTSLQLDIQAEKTINPSTSEQVAVSAGFYTTGEVKVGAIQTEILEVSQNGTYTPTDGKFISEVNVQVNTSTGTINLQEIEITENGEFTPDGDYDGFSRVKVNVPPVGITPSGTINITTNDTYDVTNYATAIVEVSPSGPSAPTIKTLTSTPDSNSLTLSFSSLEAEPKFFSVTPTDNITLATTRYITGIEYDGTNLRTSYSYKQSSYGNSYTSYDTSNVSQSYSNGTLTLTSASTTSAGYFRSGVEYQLTYIY